MVTLVFKHGKIAGDPELFILLLKEFEAENPGIEVLDEELPSSSDEQHQYYVINLAGGGAEFDVLSMDVIWVPEFAHAGWLRDVSHLLQQGERDKFFPGPVEAVTYRGKVYALPWYIDAGLLYYRKDLLEKYGFKEPPRTWGELIQVAKIVASFEPQHYGFVWQGKQYEGLVCNALEYMYSAGGAVLEDGKVVIDSEQNRQALQVMQDLVKKHGVSPELISTSMEEDARHIFGQGKAVFMRNWPYAWNIYQQEGSPVKGKVGVSVLPSFEGQRPAATLGGWQLGINKNSRHPRAAEKLLQYLTSAKVQKKLALSVGYKPARKALYKDRELKEKQPFIALLYDVFMSARPRPVTPRYMEITQVLQPEFSAVLAGYKTPREALREAQKRLEGLDL